MAAASRITFTNGRPPIWTQLIYRMYDDGKSSLPLCNQLFYIAYDILSDGSVLTFVSTRWFEQHECVIWRLTHKECYTIQM